MIPSTDNFSGASTDVDVTIITPASTTPTTDIRETISAGVQQSDIDCEANHPASSITEDPTSAVHATALSGRKRFTYRSLTSAFDNLFPNRTLAVGAIVAISVEVSLLGKVALPVYAAGPRMAIASIAFLTWFWLTSAICIHNASRTFLAWQDKVAQRRSRTTLVLISLLMTTISLAYAVSWGIFLQTSRFANWEVLSFAVANQRDLWLYLTQAEPIHLLRGLAVVAVGILAFPCGMRRFAHLRDTHAGQPLHRNRLWIWGTIVDILAVLPIVQDQSHRRRSENVAHLSHSLNPIVAFGISLLESTLSEPIRPVLDESELVPLASPWMPPVANRKHPSIIVVAVESLRSDVIYQVHQGIEVTPNINRLSREGLQWTNAYSQSTHSDYADVCIVSSLYPLRTREHHYYTTNDPWPKTLVYDTLKPAGYQTAIISSQNELWGGMEHFLASPNLDFFYHPQRSKETHLGILPARDLGFAHEVYTGHLKIGKFPDRHTADKAIAWVKQQANDNQPFFLSMNLQSSHFPFAMPDDVPRPFQPCELDPDVMFMIYPEHRTPKVKNAYFNAVHEADRQIGRLVETLKELHLDDNVLLLVIGENGEAFHENNTVGHGREPYEPAIHVATIMWGNKYIQPRVESYPLEHIDLLPTIYGLLGWQPHPNFQGIDVLSPERPALDERLLFFHTRSPSSFCDAVQYAGRWKYMWSFDYDNGTLCDLVNDPTESIDFSEKEPELAQRLYDILMEWRAKQLAYYHFPSYYQRYYPPKPPQWGTK